MQATSHLKHALTNEREASTRLQAEIEVLKVCIQIRSYDFVGKKFSFFFKSRLHHVKRHSSLCSVAGLIILLVGWLVM